MPAILNEPNQNQGAKRQLQSRGRQRPDLEPDKMGGKKNYKQNNRQTKILPG